MIRGEMETLDYPSLEILGSMFSTVCLRMLFVSLVISIV